VIPDGLTDEQVVLAPDIFSTGLSGVESANVKAGDRSRCSRRDRSDSARPSAPGCVVPP
jgi:hypothetical protein